VDEARRGALPVRRSAFDTMRGEAKGDPRKEQRLELLSDTSEDLIVPPRFAAYPDCEDAIWQGLQKAMTGVLPPKAAVEEAARACAAVVDRAGSVLTR
jgi:ABC-type glycerol-3-phosphate transport system substrate-binding protein